jgi:hypothetical protein
MDYINLWVAFKVIGQLSLTAVGAAIIHYNNIVYARIV